MRPTETAADFNAPIKLWIGRITPTLQDFATRDRISPAFGRIDFHRPRPRRRFNDDVSIEAYRPAALILAGKQRLLGGCSSPDDRIRCALKDPFPLSAATPLPRELGGSSLISREMQHGRLVRIWGALISSMGSPAPKCSLAQQNGVRELRLGFCQMQENSAPYP